MNTVICMAYGRRPLAYKKINQIEKIIIIEKPVIHKSQALISTI
jgi:hypothetical protein